MRPEEAEHSTQKRAGGFHARMGAIDSQDVVVRAVSRCTGLCRSPGAKARTHCEWEVFEGRPGAEHSFGYASGGSGETTSEDYYPYRQRHIKAFSLLRQHSAALLEETDIVKSLARLSKNMEPEHQAAVERYSSLMESYTGAIMAGQSELLEEIKVHMSSTIASLQKELGKKHLELLENDRAAKASREIIMTMQKRMLEMQEEALKRLADIQNRVQAVLVQTYELFEFPIPRLFIVLPIEPGLWDKLNPFTHKFRLYFLCECGEHTEGLSKSPSHHIHLAKHEGYDLIRPTEFFDKYGPYLLTMLEMVKFGIATAGVIVPSLAQLNVLDGIKEIEQNLRFTKETFGSLLDDSITYVEGRVGALDPSADASNERELAYREALEGADLRQLAAFLHKADEGNALGNLYRMTTNEGHVKWVCLDHYREEYSASAKARFVDIVAQNGGEYDEHTGKVTILLSTPQSASQFYDGLAMAKGVTDLDFAFGWQWEPTKAHIQALCNAVLKSNISILRIDGYSSYTLPKDAFNRRTRSNPIMELAVSGRIQSLTIELPAPGNARQLSTACLRLPARPSSSPPTHHRPTMAAAAADGPRRTAADPRHNRIVTHWARTTPEEGIQLHLRCADVQRSGHAAFQIQTDPPSADRPCQWCITLCPIHKVASASSLASGCAPVLKRTDRSRTSPVEMEKPGPPSSSQLELELVPPSSSSTLLVLTLERVESRDVNIGIDQATESLTSSSRTRCESYRTLYIYSPKLKRDICVHSIKKQPWPQNVVFDGSDVSENDDRVYHFQIWLSGSNPRREDTRTAARFNHMQQLLWAMRKDSATTDVEIVIKDNSHRDPGQLGTTEGLEDRGKTETAKGNRGKDSPHDETHWRHDHHRLRPRQTSFLAHKCVLEITPFFSRMLNGGFREGFVNSRGMRRIELSNDMFDASIMDHLLDYLYTHELSMENGTSPQESTHPRTHQSVVCGIETPALPAQVRHIISANVGLNLQTVISEPRHLGSHHYGHYVHEQQSRQTPNAEAPSLTLKQWGALYRAGVHLEDRTLQALSMETIKARLDPETTLDQVLSWGHQHEEIKTMMVQYLVKKRRHVFGEEQTNRLRPYLWAEYEDQVDTLVEITSLIARQPE
ncbi:hypothetical protein EC968_007922 [Mortierella alpina]|nr:hypothetical protein EC968_007922 [Mortierella alpina]